MNEWMFGWQYIVCQIFHNMISISNTGMHILYYDINHFIYDLGHARYIYNNENLTKVTTYEYLNLYFKVTQPA